MGQIFELTEHVKEETATALKKLGQRPFHADLRVELFEGKGASALNGTPKGAEEDYSATIGARVYSSYGKLIASGFSGSILGLKELEKPSKVFREHLQLAARLSRHNLENKKKFVKKHPILAQGVEKIVFEKTGVFRETHKAQCKKSHEDVSLEEILKRAEKNSKSLAAKNGIASNQLALVVGEKRKIFADAAGSLIEQDFALTEGFIYVAAKGKSMETYYDTLGNYRGPEVLDGENEFGKTFEEFTEFIADGTIEVSNAPAVKGTGKPVTVVTDPWFNALLCHEIMGHPSEADRALKREGAWAGRAWWYSSPLNNMLGKQVASEELTVFSDPALEAYGQYRFDDEGTPAKKVVHIKNGVLDNFLNSRETAGILGAQPNGGMRAMSAEHVPLVRMNNTAIAPGKWKKDELISDTKEGFYLVGQKTPSIGETRQNFKITCWKIYGIKNGEVGQLYRQGGITSDSHVFFRSIDAVADDFKLFNIPNCGKGTPMQTMRVGNGGPHLRAKARISSGHGEPEASA
ncbi:MAG: TldD/PmbA family protein [Candidatus Diapherotrites archaeon]|nr:TldD/PmbA family protein [Candidatus Diapherotrites archaeon]